MPTSTKGNNSARKKAGKLHSVHVWLPELLDQNLEVYVALTRAKKGEVVAEAITEFLKQKGMQPNKRPKTKVAY